MLSLPDKVTVVDVAARDGLQSFHRWVDTDVKVAMVDRLSDAGFPVVEVTNFAHPRVIPHLRDAEEVMERIRRRPGTVYRGQAPNPRGAQRAVAAKVDEVLGLITASEAYNRKNQNMTIEQGVDAAIETFRISDAAGIPFLLAIGMSFWCAYDGLIPEERVIGLVDRFRAAGIRRYYLAGSLGMEDARHVGHLFRALLDRHPDIELGFHVHNLAGTGTANILAALDAGASFVEGSICGIGGGIMTPTSMATVGNIPTEDIVHMLNDLGIETGVSTEAAVAAAGDIAEMLEIVPRSHVVHAGTRAGIMRSAALNQREHPV
ncbi:MAG: hydroxymethylglutaryl-CoA lyase [Alphaproteobacteria bacterium]